MLEVSKTSKTITVERNTNTKFFEYIQIKNTVLL